MKITWPEIMIGILVIMYVVLTQWQICSLGSDLHELRLKLIYRGYVYEEGAFDEI